MTKSFTPEDAMEFAQKALEKGTEIVTKMATKASSLVGTTPPDLSDVEKVLLEVAKPYIPSLPPIIEDLVTKNLSEMAKELGQKVLDAIKAVIKEALSKEPPEVPNPADAIGPITDAIKTSIGFPS